jgi:prepilin peptidase CpaA
MSVLIVQAIPWAASLAALIGSAASDLKARIIPNEFSVVIAICGVALSLRLGSGEFWISVLAAVSVFVALGFLAHYGLIGGGDVKLITAVTLLVPPGSVGLLLIEIALAGGIVSLFYFAAGHLLRRLPQFRASIAKTRRKSGFGKWLRRESSRIARGYPVPYALAVLGGVATHIVRELPQCLFAVSCSQ